MKKAYKFIKEMRKTDKGRALVFFVGFGLFFLVLAIMARVDKGEVKSYEEVYSPEISIDKLLDNNFSYVYTISLDDKKYTITGKINEGVELFDYNDGTAVTKYYVNNSNVLVYSNNLWIKGEYPSTFKGFFDTRNLNSIITNSTYEAKTDYQSGKVIYKLLISSNTLNSIIDNNNTDFDEVPNEIEISFDENKNIEHIKFFLDSYCKNNEICSNSLEIDLEYSDIGRVGAIDNPLNE